VAPGIPFGAVEVKGEAAGAGFFLFAFGFFFSLLLLIWPFAMLPSCLSRSPPESLSRLW
jgi:hypothetical protein